MATFRLALASFAFLLAGCGRNSGAWQCDGVAKRVAPCGAEWTCGKTVLKVVCDGDGCKCMVNGAVTHTFGNQCGWFTSGDAAELAALPNAECGWNIPDLA